MEIVTFMEGHHLAAFQDLIFPVAVVKAFVGVDRCQQTLTNTINDCDTVEATQCLWGSGPVTSWFWLIYNCGFWKVSWKDSFQRILCCNADVFLLVFAFSQTDTLPSADRLGWTHLWAYPSEVVVRLSCMTAWNSVSLQQYLKAVLLWWQQNM